MRMNDRWWLLAAGLALFSAVGALARTPTASPPPATPPVEVSHQGFCIHKVELRCLEVVLPASAPVEFDRLPLLPDGRHGIYFYADVVASPKAVFVQALESLDEDASVTAQSSDSARADQPPLAAALAALGRKLASSGALLLTPFHGGGGDEPVRVFSALPIDGPGEFSARVVDLNGTPVPGSIRSTMSVLISGGLPSRQ